jgi:hypothetical protein
MPLLTRRSLLAGAAGMLALAACGGDDDAAGPTTTGPAAIAGGPPPGDDLVLGEAFDRNNLVVAGIPQRAAYLLFVSSGGLVHPGEAPDSLAMAVTTEDGAEVATVDVARHGDDLDRAYYPLMLTFPAAGLHRVTTTVGGQQLDSSLAVNDRSVNGLTQVGDPLPAPTTPTTAAPLDTATICTHTPTCPFHEVSLDTAVGAGPVAFIVSTPAYCNTAICGPVLEQLIAAAPEHPGLTFVHLEVYPFAAPPDGEPSPLVTEPFHLTYEPVLYVADANGIVTARLDNVWDGTELASALGTV